MFVEKQRPQLPGLPIEKRPMLREIKRKKKKTTQTDRKKKKANQRSVNIHRPIRRLPRLLLLARLLSGISSRNIDGVMYSDGRRDKFAARSSAVVLINSLQHHQLKIINWIRMREERGGERERGQIHLRESGGCGGGVGRRVRAPTQAASRRGARRRFGDADRRGHHQCTFVLNAGRFAWLRRWLLVAAPER